MSQSNIWGNWLSYQTVTLKKITCIMTGHSFSIDLKFLQSSSNCTLLYIFNCSAHFPRAVLCAPHKYGGMGIYSYFTQHMTEQIILFMHHIQENDDVCEILQASLSITQLEIGTNTSFFELPHDNMHFAYTPT